jgi:hypothetical protein
MLKFEDATTFNAWVEGLQLLLPLLTGTFEELQSLSLAPSLGSTSHIPKGAELMDLSTQHNLVLTALNLQMGLSQPALNSGVDEKGQHEQSQNGVRKRRLSTGSIFRASRRNSLKDPRNETLQKAQQWAQASMEVTRRCQSQAALGQQILQSQQQWQLEGVVCSQNAGTSCDIPGVEPSFSSGLGPALNPKSSATIGDGSDSEQDTGSFRVGQTGGKQLQTSRARGTGCVKKKTLLHQSGMLATAAALHMLEEGDEILSPGSTAGGAPFNGASIMPGLQVGLHAIDAASKQRQLHAQKSASSAVVPIDSGSTNSSSGSDSKCMACSSSGDEEEGVAYRHTQTKGVVLRTASLPANLCLAAASNPDKLPRIKTRLYQMKSHRQRVQQGGLTDSAAAAAIVAPLVPQGNGHLHTAPSSAREAPLLRNQSSNGGAPEGLVAASMATTAVTQDAHTSHTTGACELQAKELRLGLELAADSLPNWEGPPVKAVRHSKAPSFLFPSAQEDMASAAGLFAAHWGMNYPVDEPTKTAAGPAVVPHCQGQGYMEVSCATAPQQAVLHEQLKPSMPSMADLARIGGCRSSSAAEEQTKPVGSLSSKATSDSPALSFDFAVTGMAIHSPLPEKSVKEQLQGWASGASGPILTASAIQQSTAVTAFPTSTELSMGGGLATLATAADLSSGYSQQQLEKIPAFSKPRSGGGSLPTAKPVPGAPWVPGRTDSMANGTYQAPLSQDSITPGTPYAAARALQQPISTASSVSSVSSIHNLKLEPGFGRRFLSGNRSGWYSIEDQGLQGHQLGHSPLAMQSSSRSDLFHASNGLGRPGMEVGTGVVGSPGNNSPPGVHTLQSAYLQATGGSALHLGNLTGSTFSNENGSQGQRFTRVSTSSSQGPVGYMHGGADWPHAGEGVMKAESPRFLQLRVPKKRISSMQSGIDSWRSPGKLQESKHACARRLSRGEIRRKDMSHC